MQLSDFDYHLPKELIAHAPLAERSASRLLCLDAQRDEITHRQIKELADLLDRGDLLVFNNTRVIPARLYGQKETGGQVEVMIERLLSEDEALAMIRASKSPRPGTRIRVGNQWLEVQSRDDELFRLRCLSGDFLTLLEAQGHMPLPPYIEREDNETDRERYQTLYAQRPGAVAAPTAGLHFDESLFAALEQKGVQKAFVTLHVGAGTFQPVRVDNIHDHRMHSEWLEVSETLCQQVRDTRQRGGRVVAVGTTSVRCLESAAAHAMNSPDEIVPFQGETDIFIYPGYQFRVVDALLTNFHLPKSTLIMLVSAFAGRETTLKAYRQAVDAGYRFFSYGDAMLITNPVAGAA